MAITLTAAARNAACDAIVDLVDGGSSDSTGDLVLMTAGDGEVATLAFSNPAFGASSAGVATASALSNDTSATGGTATKCKVVDRDNVTVWEGTVGITGSGEDVELASNIIGAGDIVAVTSCTFTMPESV
jgi:hypothetical protein